MAAQRVLLRAQRPLCSTAPASSGSGCENAGSLAHNLKLARDGQEVGGTPSLPAGETGAATVPVAPGRYEMVCTVGDHAELGMTGELQVKE